MTATSEHLSGQLDAGAILRLEADYVDKSIDDKDSLGASAVRRHYRESYNSVSDAHVSTDVVGYLTSNVRTTIENMSSDHRQLMNDLLNNDEPSPWLKQAVQTVSQQVSRQEYMQKQDSQSVQFDYIAAITAKNGSGDYAVSDTLLLNFLEWHQHAVAEEQMKFNKGVERQVNNFKDRFRQAITEGWIPEWVDSRLNYRLKNVHFIIDDGMRTQVMSRVGAGGYAARYLDSDTSSVVLAPFELMQGEINRDKIITHELVHVVDGYMSQDDETNEWFRSEMRGLQRLFPDDNMNWGLNVLNEAVVEHLTDSMYNEVSIDLIDPDAPQREGAVYMPERYLLDTLCYLGKEPIDVRLFIAAHFQDGEEDTYQGEQPLEALKSAIEVSFPGMNILERIGRVEHMDDVKTLVESIWAEIEALDLQGVARRAKRRKIIKYSAAVLGTLAGGVMIAGLSHEDVANDVKPVPGVSSKFNEGQTNNYFGVGEDVVSPITKRLPQGAGAYTSADKSGRGYSIDIPSKEVGGSEK